MRKPGIHFIKCIIKDSIYFKNEFWRIVIDTKIVKLGQYFLCLWLQFIYISQGK